MKSLQIGFIGLVLCVANAWAGPSSIQGIVKDAKGQPIKGGDVRIESRDGKQLFNTVKTDGKGRYISEGLQPGVYRVTLIVNGAVKSSITNTKTKADEATQLNFDLRPLPAAQVNAAEKKGAADRSSDVVSGDEIFRSDGRAQKKITPCALELPSAVGQGTRRRGGVGSRIAG